MIKGENGASVFALDVGGAFIKTAYLPTNGKTVREIMPFELWRSPEKLEDELKKLRPKRGKYVCALTMTGELCDCFKNRREGVGHIVESAKKAFGETLVFGLKSGLMGAKEAMEKYNEVASANWALPPILIGRTEKGFLLADIGSTTTDLTPVRNWKIANKGFSDFERMKNGELVYTGYLRTPVQFLVQSARIKGADVPLSSEYFCQTGDVHLIMGDIPAKKYISPSPDGGPKTAAGAFRRLSRCLLADDGEATNAELREVAGQIASAQRDKIVGAAARFGMPIIPTGTGAFILDEAFKSGRLARHKSTQKYAGIDPSLALAQLVKNGEF